MTDFDKKLIEKAKRISRWRFRNIDVLIDIADTEEAKQQLREIRADFYDLCKESL